MSSFIDREALSIAQQLEAEPANAEAFAQIASAGIEHLVGAWTVMGLVLRAIASGDARVSPTLTIVQLREARDSLDEARERLDAALRTIDDLGRLAEVILEAEGEVRH